MTDIAAATVGPGASHGRGGRARGLLLALVAHCDRCQTHGFFLRSFEISGRARITGKGVALYVGPIFFILGTLLYVPLY